MKKNIEILSPAGSYESMRAAIAAGADAIYIGGSRFGARAFANNLEEDMLLQAIDYVHLHGRKIYLTVNTLLKEQELNELYDYLRPYYERGLDAVIVQDIGVLMYIREQFPDLPVHASTQMTITNVSGAKFLESLGVERVVTARELQLHEIREIADLTDVEIESFVHGALCYCYSGQCLYSSILGGRSGNRGQCAQPCRLPYKVDGKKNAEYVLSLKDICTLEYIPQLVEAGIHSFKIEGRMKKPEYVGLVTAMYRKYVDLYEKVGKDKFFVDPKDREMLMDLYNRGGSHGGYYTMRNGREMISLDRPNHAGVKALQVVSVQGKSVTAKAMTNLNVGDVVELPFDQENYTFSQSVKKGQKVTFVTHNRQKIKQGQILNRTRNEQLIRDIQELYLKQAKKEKMSGSLILSVGEQAVLQLQYQDYEVTVLGEVVEEAKNQPMDEGRIEKQMRKTGNTEFEFLDLHVVLDGKVFVPMQVLNNLRRTGIEMLEEQILSSARRVAKDKMSSTKSIARDCEQATLLYAYVETEEQFERMLRFDAVRRVYLDCNLVEHIWNNDLVSQLIERAHGAKKELYLAMPHIFRADTKKQYERYSANVLQAGWDGILVRNYESIQFLREQDFKGNVVTDFNMYQFNCSAKDFWLNLGMEHTTAPLELNYRELSKVGLEQSELVIYGHAPMMVSAQCVTKTIYGCRREKGEVVLRDRYQKDFIVRNNCDYCYNIIYNTLPVVLSDQKEEIRDLNPKALRLHFTVEKGDEIDSVIDLYEDVFVKDQPGREADFAFTRGHFKRGIK